MIQGHINTNFHQATPRSVFDSKEQDPRFQEYRRRWTELPALIDAYWTKSLSMEYRERSRMFSEAQPITSKRENGHDESMVADRCVGCCTVLCQLFVLDGIAASRQGLG